MDEKPLESTEAESGKGKWYVREPAQPPSRASNVMAFGLWVAFGAAALGAVFVFEPYAAYFVGSKYRSDREQSRQFVEKDTLTAMRHRFWWGTAAGGAGAAIYWFLRNNRRQK